jgi:hypothetical protein
LDGLTLRKQFFKQVRQQKSNLNRQENKKPTQKKMADISVTNVQHRKILNVGQMMGREKYQS